MHYGSPDKGTSYKTASVLPALCYQMHFLRPQVHHLSAYSSLKTITIHTNYP